MINYFSLYNDFIYPFVIMYHNLLIIKGFQGLIELIAYLILQGFCEEEEILLSYSAGYEHAWTYQIKIRNEIL